MGCRHALAWAVLARTGLAEASYGKTENAPNALSGFRTSAWPAGTISLAAKTGPVAAGYSRTSRMRNVPATASSGRSTSISISEAPSAASTTSPMGMKTGAPSSVGTYWSW